MPTFEWKLVQPLWNTVWSFLKKLKIITIWPSNYFSGYLPEKFGANIRWMDKEDVVHIYNEILLGHKIRWNTAICNNVDGSWEYHVKWNESDREGQKSHDFSHMLGSVVSYFYSLDLDCSKATLGIFLSLWIPVLEVALLTSLTGLRCLIILIFTKLESY